MRVSIVICNHNYEEFVESAIRSALEQDHPDTQVIVVDDGSTDGSRSLIDKWKGRVVTLYKDNGGQISAYNVGFERVTGEIVIFLDSDDLLDRDACSRVAETFAPGVVKAHYRLRLIDRAGRALGPSVPSRLAEGDLGHMLRRRAELYDSSPGSGNAYRVSALRRLMPLPGDDRDRHGADFFATYGISLLGTVRAAATRCLASYRVHRPAGRETLVFGNAAGDGDAEPLRTKLRYQRFRDWIVERLGPAYGLPLDLRPNFSLEKLRYAHAIFERDSYFGRVRAGAPLLASSLLPSIARIRGSVALRVGLVAWAVGVLVLPRAAGFPLARRVCTPASR